MKKTRYRRRLLLLYLFSFLASIGPLVACFVANWERYTKTPGSTVKLCAGGVIVSVFIALKVIGKLRMPRRIVVFGLVFVLSYLLKALLNDLILISGMAFLGEVVDTLIFRRAIVKTREQITISKTADVTTSKVEEVVKKYIGRV